MVDQPTIVQGEVVANEGRHPIYIEIDPESALPLNLQGRSYDDDIWTRVKNHPLRNPTLFQKKLDEDTDSREIIRQVMSASQQRECEILLHSQARVFRQILARVLTGVQDFLSEPVIPALRAPAPPLRFQGSASENSTDRETEIVQPEDSRNQLTKFIAWIVTPKYMLFAVLGFLGVATGWSQLEIYHLRNSIDAYEQSIAASDDLREKMNEVVVKSEKETSELKTTWKAESEKTADLQSKLNQAAHDLNIQIQGEEFKTRKIAELQVQLKKFRENLKADEKTAADNLATITKQRDDLTVGNAVLTSDIAVLKERAASLESEINKLATVQETLVNERTQFAKKKRELTNRIHDLQDTETAYFDANACIKNIKTEINRWRYNHDKVNDFIKTYETQRDIHRRRIARRASGS